METTWILGFVITCIVYMYIVFSSIIKDLENSSIEELQETSTDETYSPYPFILTIIAQFLYTLFRWPFILIYLLIYIVFVKNKKI